MSGRRPNLCGCVWLANVAGLLCRHSGRRAGLQWQCWRIAGLLSGLCQLAGGFGFRLSLNSLASSAFLILTLAMCGPRERYEELSVCDDGTSLVIAVADGVAGAGFAAKAGALCGVAERFVAGAVFARFRRLRDLPPSRTMRPYSATRARLVLTQWCSSNSAMAA